MGLLPWVVLIDAMDDLIHTATRVRQFLEAYRYSTFHPVRNHRLNANVDELDRFQYRLKRIAALVKERSLASDIPSMAYVSPISPNASPEEPDATQATVRNELRDNLVLIAKSLVRRTRADARVSFRRAQHLLQMRVNSTILRWAIVTAFFTLVAAAATVVALLVHVQGATNLTAHP